LLAERIIRNTINPIIAATMKMPVHTPALNMPPITSQELNTVVISRAEIKVDIRFIIKSQFILFNEEMEKLFLLPC
jgi:hypothetical protein